MLMLKSVVVERTPFAFVDEPMANRTISVEEASVWIENFANGELVPTPTRPFGLTPPT